MRGFSLGLLAVAAVVAFGVWWAAGRQSRPDSVAWRGVERTLRTRFADVPTITTDRLGAWLADSTRPPPVLLDAREPEEYAVSHLPGARRVDPGAEADALAATLDGIGADQPIVVYCSVGVRSGVVAQRLAEAGFEDVRNLEGSIFRWANEGRPVVRDGEGVREVHPYDAVWGRLLKPGLHAE